MKIAAAAGVEISEATQAVYLQTLITLDLDALTRATNRVVREWDKPHMMPPLAFILERVDSRELAAEQAWEFVQRVITKHWHPDIGFYRDAPQLDAITDYAIRQCGGLHRIHNATDKEFGFIRREFLTAHQRFNEEGGEQTRISRELAERTLQALKQGDMNLISGGGGDATKPD